MTSGDTTAPPTGLHSSFTADKLPYENFVLFFTVFIVNASATFLCVFIQVEDDEEIEVDKEPADEREDIPLLFTTCTEDVGINSDTPAWTSRLSFKSHPNDSVVVLRSNVWPGLLAFAAGKVADVVYIGWGHKYVARNFIYPSPLVGAQLTEYPIGPDIMEINDPSVEEEEEYQKKLEIDRLAEDNDDDDDGDDEDENDVGDKIDEGSGSESEENQITVTK